MTGAHKDVVLLFERQLYHAERCKVQKDAMRESRKRPRSGSEGCRNNPNLH